MSPNQQRTARAKALLRLMQRIERFVGQGLSIRKAVGTVARQAQAEGHRGACSAKRLADLYRQWRGANQPADHRFFLPRYGRNRAQRSVLDRRALRAEIIRRAPHHQDLQATIEDVCADYRCGCALPGLPRSRPLPSYTTLFRLLSAADRAELQNYFRCRAALLQRANRVHARRA